MRKIVRQNGIGRSGLFRGLTATVCRDGLWNMLYFGIYHHSQQYIELHVGYLVYRLKPHIVLLVYRVIQSL